MSYGIIYLYRNKINSKCYVGQTTYDKPRDHRRSKYPLGRAIQKYGLDNFEVSVVEHCNDQDELNDVEAYYVKHYRSLYPGGYNLTTGGGSYGKHCKESRRKMSKSQSKLWDNEEHRKNMSEAHKGPRDNRRKGSGGVDIPCEQ